MSTLRYFRHLRKQTILQFQSPCDLWIIFPQHTDDFSLSCHGYIISFSPQVSGESEHFSTFAFNGREGQIVWSHKPGDFEANVTAREVRPFGTGRQERTKTVIDGMALFLCLPHTSHNCNLYYMFLEYAV